MAPRGEETGRHLSEHDLVRKPGSAFRDHALRGPGQATSHVVIVPVVQHVADIEHDGLVALVFPPVRRALHFGANLAGFVVA